MVVDNQNVVIFFVQPETATRLQPVGFYFLCKGGRVCVSPSPSEMLCLWVMPKGAINYSNRRKSSVANL